MPLAKILSIPLSIWKCLLNILSVNYIARLEMRIEFLEADNKRKEEIFSELTEIIQARQKLLDEKEERMKKEIKEKERQPAEIRQFIDKQSSEELASISSIVERFFSEFRKLTFLRAEVGHKSRQLVNKMTEEKKMTKEDLLKVISYDDEVDSAEIDFTIKAINLIGQIRTIIGKKKL